MDFPFRASDLVWKLNHGSSRCTRLPPLARDGEVPFIRYRPFDPSRVYTPEEREPWDALCDRYLRAVEMAIRLFRTLERSRLATNSESYRDLLGNMAKWGVIADPELWFRMRDIRNRIAHDYLPEQLRDIYGAIHGDYGPELLRLRDASAGPL